MARLPKTRNRVWNRQPRARDRVWQSMRMLRTFTTADLVATAEANRDNVIKYVRGLTAAGYRLQHGKFVFEAKPEGANKGRALERCMHRKPFIGRHPVMIGDDTTDEDAFVVTNQLGGLTVKVGPGDSAAQYRLRDVEAVHGYLKELAGA